MTKQFPKKMYRTQLVVFFYYGNLEILPFFNEIMKAPYSSKFKQLDLPKYDNTMGNPVEHLIDFKSKLMLYAQDGAVIDKLFPRTLQ